MEKKREFGELELAVLQFLRGKERATVRQVLEAFGGKDKYTTVMTVMNRMVEKKILRRERIGQHYEYWIPESSLSSPPNFLEKLKEKTFGGKSASMVCYLLESSSDITEEELEDVEKRIQEMRKTRKQS